MSTARPAYGAAGIENAGGRLTVSFSTVTLNKGAGIDNNIFLTGVATIHDTIVAGNVGAYDDSTALLPFDCFGAIRSLGHNLIGVIQPHSDPSNGCSLTTARGDQVGSDRSAPIDAKLGPLAANGAFTPTHALLDGSPAINHADSTSAVCPVDDQRGIVRRRIPGDACDVGAFEKVEPGCGLDCNLWRIVSVCARNPFVCEKLLVPKIENLPPVPDCLLDGPGCLIPPPVDFQ